MNSERLTLPEEVQVVGQVGMEVILPADGDPCVRGYIVRRNTGSQ